LVNDVAMQEQRVLLHSIAVTIGTAVIGVLFGLLSGSLSIAFDGMFSVIDAAISSLALLVARLLTQEGGRRFQHGYWHIEPLVLAFNGGILIILCCYALVNAIGSLLEGGRALAFDWAIGYTLMAAVISAALLLAFVIASAVQDTAYAGLSHFADPVVLAVLSICLLPLPVRTVVRAWGEILLITPSDLDLRIRRIMNVIVHRHGFARYKSYVAKVGRARFIEIHIVLPPGFEPDDVASQDAFREEIARAIGDDGPQLWLTIAFTADPSWI
jgi:predicted Co/Zn/Cd cation transporter (cation efflux family)